MRRTSRCVASISSRRSGTPAHHGPLRRGWQLRERRQQLPLATGLHGNGFHHGATQQRGKLRRIHVHAALARDVAEVQRDDHRPPEAHQLQRQTQPQPQVGGVHDIDDDIRDVFALEAAEHDIARDGFIQRGRSKAVGAGQIEHAVAAAEIGVGHRPSLRSTVTPA